MAERAALPPDLDRNLALELVRATEAAAMAAARHLGRGDKELVDQAAVDAMRPVLGSIEMNGVVVIGEGEKDNAPMLYNGEQVGNGGDPRVDIAVDPVDGTTLTARSLPNAIAVVALAERGTMFDPGPCVYMEKLAVGRDAAAAVDFEAPIETNLQRIAAAKGSHVTELTVCVLDRPRHEEELVGRVRASGARIKFLLDGDVAGAIMAARAGTGVDVLVGIGGTPEGVIAACALKCLDGALFGRLWPRDETERRAALDAGYDLERVLTVDDLVRGENVFFAATGVTDGELLRGVRFEHDEVLTQSLSMRSRSGAVRLIDRIAMPIASPETYAEMLDRAKAGGFAYPAVNVTSSETLNAALRGFAEASSDGIVQVSTGGAAFLSGQRLKDMVAGAVALAEFAHVVAAKHPVQVALHTDHCPKDKLDGYMRPLVRLSRERVAAGQAPLFQSHMWDGSAVPLEDNLQIARELLAACAQARVVMELEIGVVGGEEDDVVGEMSEKLYSTPEDALRVAEMLGTGEQGRYLLAATFGNVHGVYQPGHVKLRPELLAEIQQAVGARVGTDRPFDLVFHGGSGSLLTEIREAISYGVVKMNIDTDTQYAFTRPIADHMLRHYDGVLRIDGAVGDKKAYDPRSFMAKAEGSMAARVTQACEDLKSAGTAMSG